MLHMCNATKWFNLFVATGFKTLTFLAVVVVVVVAVAVVAVAVAVAVVAVLAGFLLQGVSCICTM